MSTDQIARGIANSAKIVAQAASEQTGTFDTRLDAVELGLTNEIVTRGAADTTLSTSVSDHEERIDDLEVSVDTLEGTVTSGRIGKRTWAALNAVVGTAGQLAEVPLTDTGTHTDPVVGGTVNNSGIFSYSTSPAGWERLYDVDAASADASADAAAASASTASAAATALSHSIAEEYGAILGASGGWVHDLKYWRTMLFKDAAATQRVTADGDPVACIRDRLGDSNNDLVWVGADASRPTFRIKQGKPCIVGVSGSGLQRRGGALNVPMNTLLIAALEYEQITVNASYGFVKNEGTTFYLANQNTAAYAWISSTTLSRPTVTVQSQFYSAPLYTATVASALAEPGRVSVWANDTTPDNNSTKVTTWLASDVLPNVLFGVNVTGQSGSGGPPVFGTKSWVFYGGATFFGGSVDREFAVAKFMTDITVDVRSTDTVYVGYGASDTDDADTSTGAYGEELYLRWARDTLVPANPQSSVIYIKANRLGESMTGWRQLSLGSTDHRLFVINMSVGGAQPTFWLGDKFPIFFTERLPHIDRFIWNQGGNSGVTNNIDPLGYMRVGEYIESFDFVRRHYPTTPHISFRVHPLRQANNPIAPVVSAHDKVVPLYGDMHVVDVYSHFMASTTGGDTLTLPDDWFHADNAHLMQPAGVNEQLGVFLNSMATYTPPAQVAAPLLRIGLPSDTIYEAYFGEFDQSGDGWTAVVGASGLIERSAIQVDTERGALHSCRIKSATGGGATYVNWRVNAVPLVLSPIIVSLRQFLVAGGTTSTGQLQLRFLDSTNTPVGITGTSWLQSTNNKPTGVWRWTHFAAPPVPSNATIIEFRVWGAAAGQAGECFVSDAYLNGGLIPLIR